MPGICLDDLNIGVSLCARNTTCIISIAFAIKHQVPLYIDFHFNDDCQVLHLSPFSVLLVDIKGHVLKGN